MFFHMILFLRTEKEFIMNHSKLILFVLLTITSANCPAEIEKSKSKANVLSLSRRNCVRILIDDKPVGSGFFIHKSHVATCCHVITAKVSIDQKQKKFEWKAHAKIFALCDDGEKIEAICVSQPTKKDISPLVHDFAVLKLKQEPKNKATILQFYNWKQTPSIGSEIYFSGFPLGSPTKLTHKGMVSGLTANNNIVCIQAPINKGNSGSALLNFNGEIIGMVSMREGGISKGLKQLRDQITKTESQGSLSVLGVNTLQSTKEIVNVLDLYISTGIGYARNIKYLSAYIKRHSTLKGK